LMRAARLGIEDDARGLLHDRLHLCYVGLDPIYWRLDQHGVVHRCAQLDAAAMGQDAGYAQDFRPSALNWPIADRALVEFGDPSLALPSVHGAHASVIESMRYPIAAPGPVDGEQRTVLG